MFYGDGGRIVKVKVEMDYYARAFKTPTKKNDRRTTFPDELDSSSLYKNYRKMIITSKLYN